MTILHVIKDVILWMGISIISYGALKAFVHYILFVLKKTNASINDIRQELGTAIILGLEFTVGSDVIETITNPSYYEVGILVILVAIRIILGYFLQQELQEN